MTPARSMATGGAAPRPPTCSRASTAEPVSPSG